jgi:hypothetical protein
VLDGNRFMKKYIKAYLAFIALTYAAISVPWLVLMAVAYLPKWDLPGEVVFVGLNMMPWFQPLYLCFNLVAGFFIFRFSARKFLE